MKSKIQHQTTRELVKQYLKNILLLVNKKQVQTFTLFFLIVTLFSSCSVVEGIFKAGMGFGIFIIVAIIVLIIYIFSKFTGKK